MAEFSIIDKDLSSNKMVALSPYYTDFNIDRIMKDINAYWKEDVSSLYRYFPSDEYGQEYRKEIYGDVCKEGMYEALMLFREKMKQRKNIIEDKERTRFELQKKVMTLNEMSCYVEAVDTLAETLSTIPMESEGMTEYYKLLNDYVSEERFINLKNKAAKIRASLDSIPIKLNYQDHFINVSLEDVDGKYDDFLKEFLCNKRNKDSLSFFQRKNPLGDSVEITLLEQEILLVIHKKYPAIFDELNELVKEYKEYAEDYIVQFSEDIAFYLSFHTFQKAMEKRGLYFAPSVKSTDGKMSVEDLYDLALACQLIREERIPVSNDVRLEKTENFFVLTGPNQGGKTTFARSLGQLVFFSKLGLPVPARSAFVPFYSRILSHFSVEESVETGKGKLAEELSRLAPMMEDKAQKNDFVVINELFTTAANYDACIMGKRVLDHFIKQNCHGIYVTHLQELSKEDPGVVSLRAMMNEEHRQNFKIVRSTEPALESSILLVEKHGLHYEDVIKRLKGEE